MNNIISIKNLSKSYIKENEELKVLDNINIDISNNSFVSIIGPSGCGKTTILRIISGLEKEYFGDVSYEGKSIDNSSFKFGYMQQKDSLMPWRTVMQNIILPLEIRGSINNETLKVIKLYLIEFGLDGFENYYPDELSGGMRQRVALLRTYLMEGDIMLLDEPFGALDALTRTSMQKWLLNIWQEHKKSVLFITHNIDEAIFLSDKIYIMSERPGTIIKKMDINFKRPRNLDILISSEFSKYKGQIQKSLL